MNQKPKEELSFVRLFITIALDWRLVMAVVVLIPCFGGWVLLLK